MVPLQSLIHLFLVLELTAKVITFSFLFLNMEKRSRPLGMPSDTTFWNPTIMSMGWILMLDKILLAIFASLSLQT
jgi:hypothetical protein